ncbi:mechanosensitive ion channel family protein [Halorhabdus amylolytica]|uniref:mechanosensitive ion channel family protein n=1 Tax=Halorhabdus amylolytica TaxID=2559573 RepID=UPI0010AB14CC|nr:hypothetical protein [Halorhabdus amylolytica]
MSLTPAVVTDAVVPLFVDTFSTTFGNAIEMIITQLPRFFGGLAILLGGLLLGVRLQPVVVGLCRRTGIDEVFDDTPVAALFGGEAGAISRAVGAAVKYYVILFGALLAVDVTEFQELNTWLKTLVVWVPQALAGVAIILVGLVLIESAVRQARRSDVVEESDFGVWIPATVRATLYVIVFVIGLDMIGINLEIVYLIVEGITSAIGLGIVAALALGLGVATGLFAKEYVDRELQSRAEG